MLRKRFAVNAETYRQRLRATKLKIGDEVTDLAMQVYTLTDRWLQESEDRVETVALEQFYNAMPLEIAEWLRDQQPATLMEAAGKVVECQQNHKSKENGRYPRRDTFREPKRNKRAMKHIKAVNYSERKITVMY